MEDAWLDLRESDVIAATKNQLLKTETVMYTN